MRRRRSRTIPGQALEIRYRRSGSQRGRYFHGFRPGVKMYANADGSVTLRGPRRIHADDREPGFWERYGHGENAGRGGMGRIAGIKTEWIVYGVVAYFMFRAWQQSAATAPASAAGAP